MNGENDNREGAEIAAEEKHATFVTTTEDDGTTTRGKTVGSVDEKIVYQTEADEDDDMPLPSDPKTVFLGGLFILAVLCVLSVAAEIVLPLVVAIVLKLLLQPLVRTLERFRVPRAIGAMLSVLLVLVVFGGTLSLLAGPATTWAAKLPQAIPKIRDSFGFLKGPIDDLHAMFNQVAGVLGDQATGSSPGGSTLKPASLVSALLGGTAAVTSGFFTTLLILFYLLVSGETFLRRIVEILPRFKDKRNAVELSFHIERDVSAYLLTITCINLLVGVATGLAMWACGVDNPLLWGAIAFILNFVPFLGPMVGIVIFLMASVLSLGVQWFALLPVGLYFAVHVIEGEICTPTLLARRFTINPVAVILALIFWFWLWGIVGAILAVPMLAITKIICDDIRPLRAVGHLLEG
jgi:predicted PurR-regulated permease PerM